MDRSSHPVRAILQTPPHSELFFKWAPPQLVESLVRRLTEQSCVEILLQHPAALRRIVEEASIGSQTLLNAVKVLLPHGIEIDSDWLLGDLEWFDTAAVGAFFSALFADIRNAATDEVVVSAC
jgi:hypothetical protein